MRTLLLFVLMALAMPAFGQVAWREATAAEMAAGTAGTPAAVTPRRLGPVATNGGTVQALPFIVLHNNKTASVWTNGYGSTNVTLYSFPSSTTAGFNELQSLFNFSSNAPASGFREMIDPGLYTFTTQLVISNNCSISGAGPSATIFRYVGSTNFATMQNITNILAGAGGDACSYRAVPYSLLVCTTNSQAQAGIENISSFNVELSDISVQTSTNMFCIGVTVIGGDHTVLDSVFSAGPELWTKPSYYAGFLDFQQVPEASKMIGFLIGGNQPILNHCRAVAVADGIVAEGDSFLRVNDFNAITLDYSGLDQASPYPVTSEFAQNSAILIPTNSNCEELDIDHMLFFDCVNDFYIGSQSVIVNARAIKDQNSLFQPSNFRIYVGVGGNQARVQITDSSYFTPITVQAWTNTVAGGYVQNGSVSAYVTDLTLNTTPGLISATDGTTTFFTASRSGASWAGNVGNNVQLNSGRNFVGSGSGITNATTSYLTNLVNPVTNVNTLTRAVQWTIPVVVSAPATTLGSAEIDAQIQRSDGVWATVADCDIAGGATSVIATNKAVLVFTVPSGASMRLTNSTSGTGYVAGLDATKTNTFTVLP